MESSERDILSCLLDVRTVNMYWGGLDEEAKAVAFASLEGVYVEYAINQARFVYNAKVAEMERAAAEKACMEAEREEARRSLLQEQKTSLKKKIVAEKAIGKAKQNETSCRESSGFIYVVGSDSDSSSESEEEGAGTEEPVQPALPPFEPPCRKTIQLEFKKAFKRWRKMNVDWRAKFPTYLGSLGRDKQVDLLNDLLPLPIGKLYKELEDDPQYGLLPRLASCSRAQLGNLNAESFCERCLSVGNHILTEGNTLLGHEELEMLIVLRMNQSFMQYMREKCGREVSKQIFNQTVVTTDD